MSNTIPCRKAFTDTMLALAIEDKNVVAVTTDARGSVTLNDFADKLPAQFVECGIAEQNAVGIAAGLASCGKTVFVCGPACFYVARSLEQVKVDLAYSGFKVCVLGVSGGVSYGALGATHHSLHDIAAVRTFPGMKMVLPCDIYQAEKLVKAFAKQDEPMYVRVGRNPVENVYTENNCPFEIGKANMLMDGNDLTIIGTGETVYQCMKAGEELLKHGIKARVLDMHTIKPLDEQAIIKAAAETAKIITVEEHSIFGGLGAAVAEVLVKNNPVKMKILGIPDENAVTGNSKEIFKYYGLDSEGIVKTVLEW